MMNKKLLITPVNKVINKKGTPYKDSFFEMGTGKQMLLSLWHWWLGIQTATFYKEGKYTSHCFFKFSF